MRLKLFTAIIVSQLLCLFCIASPNNGKFILVIDAGHGGHDAGAIGTYSKEKNINLNVALAFGKLVENNCSDVRVIYTRKTDVFIALQERAEIANRNKANLFISIHTNALPNGKIAYGSETYTLGMARSSENFDVAKRENSVILVLPSGKFVTESRLKREKIEIVPKSIFDKVDLIGHYERYLGTFNIQ